MGLTNGGPPSPAPSISGWPSAATTACIAPMTATSACCSNALTSPCPTSHHGRCRADGGPTSTRSSPAGRAESLAPAADRSEPERAAGFGEKLELDGRSVLATLAIRLPEQAHRQLDLSLGQRLALQWIVGLRAGQTERPGSVVAHGKY
jgi:hypothetical protein